MPGEHETMVAVDAARVQLLRELKDRRYRFVTPTPATHARVVARHDRRQAQSLEDVLGWSLPYAPGLLDPAIETLLHTGDALADAAGLRRATLRVSSLHDHLFLHSAFPTTDPHAVFFGPDSYRFADLLARELRDDPLSAGARTVDIGTGTGVGGIVTAALAANAEVNLTDINPAALRLAAVNAHAAGVEVELHETDGLDPVVGDLHLATANPPFIIDTERRLYRDGRGMFGGEVSLAMARLAMTRLAPGGRLILYTGSAMVRGQDALRAALAEAAAAHGCAMRYRELDPDIFGEELDRPAYAEVERIALVAAVVTRAP